MGNMSNDIHKGGMNRKIAVGGFIAVAMVLLVLGSIQPVSAWTRIAPIYINNTAGNAQVYYQVNLAVLYDSDMNTNFSDLRVVRVVNETYEFLPYWIENKSDGEWCVLWFNATYIPANSWCNDTYYLLYGNASASDASNGNATFLFFEDFEYDIVETLNQTYLAETQGSPEGETYVNGYLYQAEERTEGTRIHEVNPSTGAATGNYFDFDSSDATHSSGLAWHDGYLWVVDYDKDKVYKVNLSNSLNTHSADILGSFSVGSGAGFDGHPSAIEFVTYNGSQQLLITEWKDNGKIIIVDYAQALIDGTVTGNVLKEFTEGSGSEEGNTQGLTTMGGFLYRAADQGTATDTIRKYNLPDLSTVPSGTRIFKDDLYQVAKWYFAGGTGIEDMANDGTRLYVTDETGDELYKCEFGSDYDTPTNHGWKLYNGTSLSVTDEVAKTGTRACRRWNGTNSMQITRTVNLGTNVALTWYARHYDDLDDTYYFYGCVGKDTSDRPTDRLTWALRDGYNIKYWDGDWHDTGLDWENGEWYKIEYICTPGNVRLLINGTQVYSGSRLDEINQIAPLQDYYGYDDCIYVRKYTDLEPSAILGEEQNIGTGCTSPTISSLTNSTPTTNSVIITWTTNQSADNRVKYSKNSDLSDYSWSSWDNDTTSVSITLTGLEPNTTYYYQAWSYNGTNSSCYTVEPSSQPYRSFTTQSSSSSYTITLEQGYNMIGWTSTTSKTSSELCSIVPNCSYVYKKNPDGSWTSKQCGLPGGDFTVSRGFGFLAYITQECEWTRDE